MDDLLTFLGGAVKMTDAGTAGPLKMEGRLVVFSGPDSPDLTGDYFTKETDFGVLSDLGETTVSAYYNHGMDPVVGRERIGAVKLTLGDEGVWAEYQIERRKEYLRKLAEAAAADPVLKAAGGLGQSSGALAHTFDAEERTGPDGSRARWIKGWTIGEGSPTPTPAEPRTSVVPLKSLRDASLRSALAVPAKALPVPPEGVQALRQRVEQAFRSRFLDGDRYGWVEDVFPDYVLVHTEHKSYRVATDDDEGGVTFADRADWVEVQPRTVWEPIKGLLDVAHDTRRRLQARHSPAADLDGLAASIKHTLTTCGRGAA